MLCRLVTAPVQPSRPALVRRLAAVVALGLCILLVMRPSPASAQVRPGQFAQPGGTTSPSLIKLSVRQMGLGGRLRTGHWLGVQVALSGSAVARDLLVKLSMPDVDGDTTEYQTQVTLTPGAEQTLWLYCRMPVNPPQSVALAAYEFEGTGSDRKLGALANRLDVQLNNPAPPFLGFYGIVGRAALGLELYSIRQTTYDCAPTGHEATELINGLQTSDLPDRWMGYDGLSALLWGTADSLVRPTNVSQTQAAALKEWVQRGGHLVVVLPTIATDWIGPGNPLASLLPAVSVERLERADIAGLAGIVGGKPVPEGQTREASINTFTPTPGAAPGDAITVMADEQGRAVVVRRLVGAGMVTLVGLDLASPAVLVTGGVKADSFWHRILGRRGELLTADEISKRRGNQTAFFDQRQPYPMDSFVGGQINKTGQAALGVLLALAVFSVYWVVAGPLGFTVLKRRAKSHFAWLGYLGAAAAFTAVAWGGASVLKPQRVEATHLTVMDAVAGQPIQRARMWASLLMPAFGSTRVEIKPDPEFPGLVNTLAPWEPVGGADSGGFPDARPYAVDARAPDKVAFPSRSTVKPIRVDWAGATSWKLPLPIGERDADGQPPRLRLVERSASSASSPSFGVQGKLKNELPAALEDVRIIVCRLQQPSSMRSTRQLMFRGEAYALPTTGSRWEVGTELDLDVLTSPPPGKTQAQSSTSLGELFDSLSPRATSITGNTDVREADVARRLVAMSFFSLLEPPAWQTIEVDPAFRREAWQGMDLSARLTSPCLIIIGSIGSRALAGPSPVPLMVDGSPCPMKGRTVIRWIYPLGDGPPRVDRASPEDARGAASGSGSGSRAASGSGSAGNGENGEAK